MSVDITWIFGVYEMERGTCDKIGDAFDRNDCAYCGSSNAQGRSSDVYARNSSVCDGIAGIAVYDIWE